MTLPTAGELSVLAREATARSGVKNRELAGSVPVTSPVNGVQVAAVDWATAADVDPLIHDRAWKSMTDALAAARDQGGILAVGGGRRLAEEAPGAYYAEPAIMAMPSQTPITGEETFAPLLYVLPYDTLDEAIALNNGVRQGLSSSIFTRDQAESGSDAWRAYMRRATNTVNYSGQLPLAQGVEFTV